MRSPVVVVSTWVYGSRYRLTCAIPVVVVGEHNEYRSGSSCVSLSYMIRSGVCRRRDRAAVHLSRRVLFLAIERVISTRSRPSPDFCCYCVFSRTALVVRPSEWCY